MINLELNLMILVTEDNSTALHEYKNWFCDGIIDSAPIGYQLYTSHELVSETVTIPLVS